VDWWCLGILIFEMLFGKTPFKGVNQKETFKKILLSKDEVVQFPLTPSISKNTKNLIVNLLNPNSKKRLGSKVFIYLIISMVLQISKSMLFLKYYFILYKGNKMGLNVKCKTTISSNIKR
jgi:serine/threonine protein kinase